MKYSFFSFLYNVERILSTFSVGLWCRKYIYFFNLSIGRFVFFSSVSSCLLACVVLSFFLSHFFLSLFSSSFSISFFSSLPLSLSLSLSPLCFSSLFSFTLRLCLSPSAPLPFLLPSSSFLSISIYGCVCAPKYT